MLPPPPQTEVVLWGPGAVFTAMCFCSGFLILQLPETRGRSLPTTIEDMQMWGKEKAKVKKRVQGGFMPLEQRTGNDFKD